MHFFPKPLPIFPVWSDYSKEVGGHFIKIRLKIAKKCGLYLDIFSCVKMNVCRSFFAFMLEMHVRCDNQYKTGAEREMRGYLVYVPIVKKIISSILF